MRNYYVMSGGRLKRQDNTLFVENTDGSKRPLPIEDVDTLYLYGEVDLNTRLLNFLTQHKITLHVFNFYGFYAGSYYPREYLNSGYLLVQQVAHYQDTAKRMLLAAEFVHGAAHGLLKNLAYYERRKGDGPESETTPDESLPPSSDAPTEEAQAAEHATDPELITGLPRTTDTPAEPELWERTTAFPIPELTGVDEQTARRVREISAVRGTVASLAALVMAQTEVNALRGIEGKMRERYYAAWPSILSGDWDFVRRVRRPPDNEVNALISFGNSFLYTVCLSEIYRTQLTPTISYLHEPGARRFSLALDLSEIFKPLIVDRAIFTLLNKNQLKDEHFTLSSGICHLNEDGEKQFLMALQTRLETTIKHRRLNRHVSYRHLIRLECYKLIRHLTGVEAYRAFRAWW